MYGIEKLKVVVTDVAKFAMKIEDALEDKKLQLGEAISLGVFAVPKALNHVNGAGEIVQEVKDLDDAETKELIEHIGVELDLESEKIEVVVEAGLEWLLATKVLIGKIAALRKE